MTPSGARLSGEASVNHFMVHNSWFSGQCACTGGAAVCWRAPQCAPVHVPPADLGFPAPLS